MYATCPACQREMRPQSEGCLATLDDGRTRIPYGAENYRALRSQWRATEDKSAFLLYSGETPTDEEGFIAAVRAEEPEDCPDCNVRRGQYHHLGCDREECPSCGMQAIGCGFCV